MLFGRRPDGGPAGRDAGARPAACPDGRGPPRMAHAVLAIEPPRADPAAVPGARAACRGAAARAAAPE